MVCSFISHAWHCIINAVLNIVHTLLTLTPNPNPNQSTATAEGRYWMLTASNTALVYMIMWYTIRHNRRMFNCFPGVWYVFPGLWSSLWLCWWGLLWRTPASVPALKLRRWWVHLLQFLQHSCNYKTYEGLLKSPGYCKLQHQFRFSYSYKKKPVSIFEAILILQTKASNSTATLVQHVSGGFDLQYLT